MLESFYISFLIVVKMFSIKHEISVIVSAYANESDKQKLHKQVCTNHIDIVKKSVNWLKIILQCILDVYLNYYSSLTS